VRTLHTSYRVSELDVSLAFYTALGYEQVGQVDLGAGSNLTMLKFPAEEVLTLELVHRPDNRPVDMAPGSATCRSRSAISLPHSGTCSRRGLSPARWSGTDGPQISCLTDPDGYRIELVQWPPGHPFGITTADFR
jgi:lactoylglutathione lyase